MTPPSPGTRTIRETVAIAAPREVVWRALTEADRVANWFAPIASGRAGPGGHLTVSWGTGSEWTSRFTEWEPLRHLRLVDEIPDGTPDPGSAMALDYHLEEVAGRTRLILVNSGLSADPSWDDGVRMMTNGWRFFLWNLKHYLERHPEAHRTMISARPRVSGTRAEVWEKIFGAQGCIGLDNNTFTLWPGGDRAQTGSVVLRDPPWALAGRIESLHDGVLHVELEGTGEGWRLGIWISVYDPDATLVGTLDRDLARMVGRRFPESAE